MTAKASVKTGRTDQTIALMRARSVSRAFHCVLDVFEREEVGLVVRSNDEL